MIIIFYGQNINDDDDGDAIAEAKKKFFVFNIHHIFLFGNWRECAILFG